MTELETKLSSEDKKGMKLYLEKITPFLEEIEEEFRKYFARYSKMMKTDHNSLGRVLKMHLAVESFLNDFLIDHYHFDDLETLRLSFSQKVNMIPKKHAVGFYFRGGIIELNQVRNKLGHRINYEVDLAAIPQILEILKLFRSDQTFDEPVAAIEQFSSLACSMLLVQPAHIKDAYSDALEHFNFGFDG